MKYRVVKSQNFLEFQQEIEGLLNDGWWFVDGGFRVISYQRPVDQKSHPLYLREMVKDDKEYLPLQEWPIWKGEYSQKFARIIGDEKSEEDERESPDLDTPKG